MGNSNLGQILVEIGRIEDLEEAEQCCLKAIRATPHRPQPFNNLGNVYRSMSRFEEAVECYRKAAELRPGSGDALEQYGTGPSRPGAIRRSDRALSQGDRDGTSLRQVPRQLREPVMRPGSSQ